MSYRPMSLDHVNIYVRNAERSHRWYVDILGLHTQDTMTSPETGRLANPSSGPKVQWSGVCLPATLQGAALITAARSLSHATMEKRRRADPARARLSASDGVHPRPRRRQPGTLG